jgi:hypothetical protein
VSTADVSFLVPYYTHFNCQKPSVSVDQIAVNLLESAVLLVTYANLPNRYSYIVRYDRELSYAANGRPSNVLERVVLLVTYANSPSRYSYVVRYSRALSYAANGRPSNVLERVVLLVTYANSPSSCSYVVRYGRELT